MQDWLFALFVTLAVYCFYQFITGKYQLSPLWLMLSAWGLALGIPQLNLSKLEKGWTGEFWFLLAVSLASFTLGFFLFKKLWEKYPFWREWSWFNRNDLSVTALRIFIYLLFFASLIALYLFYIKAGNFPLLAEDPDVFRFTADDKVPGLINYTAQLARLFIPLSFFLIFREKFDWIKHFDLLLLIFTGTIMLVLFASRTQIFFIDLWVMALYLFMRKPNLKQAYKFYPFFLLVSVIVLSAVPLIRQYKSYGAGYLAGVTQIDTSNLKPGGKALLPIYVGVSFNMQSLLHAQQYYETHALQMGRVTLDPFTNILGFDHLKSNYDLGEIFYEWWNTGTYLFPFVQDFGNAAFYFVPFIMAGFLTLLWQYWKSAPDNYLSLNLYAYACFFIVMTIYLSFTVRAEMYIDLFLILVSYFLVSRKQYA